MVKPTWHRTSPSEPFQTSIIENGPQCSLWTQHPTVSGFGNRYRFTGLILRLLIICSTRHAYGWVWMHSISSRTPLCMRSLPTRFWEVSSSPKRKIQKSQWVSRLLTKPCTGNYGWTRRTKITLPKCRRSLRRTKTYFADKVFPGF